MPKVKGAVESQMFLSEAEHLHLSMDFKKNFAHLLSLTNTSVMQKVFDTSKVKVTVDGQKIKFTISQAPLLHLSMDYKITWQTCSPF